MAPSIKQIRLSLFAGVVGAALLATPAFASMERARQAQARGDLRAAQIELRNAVRTSPNSAEARAALAQASIDVGDFDTAEKEARAALERGYDRAAGTAILMRAYLGLRRFDELLREFPQIAEPAALAAEVAAGRWRNWRTARSMKRAHRPPKRSASHPVASMRISRWVRSPWSRAMSLPPKRQWTAPSRPIHAGSKR